MHEISNSSEIIKRICIPWVDYDTRMNTDYTKNFLQNLILTSGTNTMPFIKLLKKREKTQKIS